MHLYLCLTIQHHPLIIQKTLLTREEGRLIVDLLFLGSSGSNQQVSSAALKQTSWGAFYSLCSTIISRLIKYTLVECSASLTVNHSRPLNYHNHKGLLPLPRNTFYLESPMVTPIKITEKFSTIYSHQLDTPVRCV